MKKLRTLIGPKSAHIFDMNNWRKTLQFNLEDVWKIVNRQLVKSSRREILNLILLVTTALILVVVLRSILIKKIPILIQKIMTLRLIQDNLIAKKSILIALDRTIPLINSLLMSKLDKII